MLTDLIIGTVDENYTDIYYTNLKQTIHNISMKISINTISNKYQISSTLTKKGNVFGFYISFLQTWIRLN